MTNSQFSILAETPCHFDAIETLAADAFGPGRFVKSAFRLREGVPHEAELSFVALDGGVVVGSVRQTRIQIGCRQAMVLGPLVVIPGLKSIGIGAALMERSMLAAKQAGHGLVILVGDEPYYARFGFQQVPMGQITLPGPADPARILYCEFEEGIVAEYAGMAERHFCATHLPALAQPHRSQGK